MKKLFDKDGKELFEFKIEIIPSPNKIIEYIAESEEECKQLFLENNSDLDEYDIEVSQTKSRGNK